MQINTIPKSIWTVRAANKKYHFTSREEARDLRRDLKDVGFTSRLTRTPYGTTESN
jgi:hypothetical protein